MDTTLPRITGYPVAGSNEVVKPRWAKDPKSTPPRPSPSPAAKGRETSANSTPASKDGLHSSALSLSRSEGEGRGGVALGRVYINTDQYFDGMPQAVWDMHIGGYRVAEKWLKDRKGRELSYDDLSHYQSVIAALARTLELQTALDTTIQFAGGWPLG